MSKNIYTFNVQKKTKVEEKREEKICAIFSWKCKEEKVSFKPKKSGNCKPKITTPMPAVNPIVTE